MSRPASFDGITEAAYPGYGYIVDLVVSCLCFGNATSYLIVMSKLMPEVMNFLGFGFIWTSRQVWVTVGLFIVGPLSYKKSLDALEFTNSMGLASVLFITFIIVAYSMHFPGLDPCADDPEQCELATTEYVSFTGSTIGYLGVFVFSYTCQMVLQNDLHYNHLHNDANKCRSRCCQDTYPCMLICAGFILILGPNLCATYITLHCPATCVGVEPVSPCQRNGFPHQ